MVEPPFEEKQMIHTKFLGATLTLLAFSSQTLAHHGWSGYDEKSPITIEGTIKNSSYKNPHGTLKLESKEKKVLEIILAPTSRMSARGLKEEMLKAGQKVTIEGYKRHSDSKELRAERITVEGKTVDLR